MKSRGGLLAGSMILVGLILVSSFVGGPTTLAQDGELALEEVRVEAGSDDAEEGPDGSISRGSSDLELVFDQGGNQTVGMRFNGVTIPPGASITYAHIQFQADETHSDPTALTVQGEAVDNAATFTNVVGDISSRRRTAAAVSWSPNPWLTVGEAGPDQQTPDIASVIQEIVDRPGWSGGNSLVIIITGTGERVAQSYNGNPSGAPLLHVEYTLGPVNQPPTATIATPANGQIFTQGDLITFTGSASDAEDGDVTASLVWVSDRDGTIGTGDSFSSNTLSAGVHTITATASDSGGLSGSDQVVITVNVMSSTPVLVGAGDIASCDSETDLETALLLDNIAGTVVTLGDHVYPDGTDLEFSDCYDPTWGRHKARTRPAAGNHDYYTPGASGYFNYFGSAAGEVGKGYYSYDVGDWHIIVLNSECSEVGGCESNSVQGQWLQADLVANPSACTLAYWHVPRFSSGTLHGSSDRVLDFWQLLYDAGADVILNGHEHNYERFAPQDPDGAAAPGRGIREFVVGTGGKSLYDFGTPLPNSEVREANTYGVLKLTLQPDSYDWEFIPIAGQTFTDSGSASCVVTAGGPIAWVEDGLTRVFKNDPARVNSNIALYTAKNEYEPFQIIVKAPASNNLTNVNVTISDLTGPNGAFISSDNINLYREHYLYVTEGSKSSNSTTNSPLGPGWYPDALIPFTDPVTHQDLTGQLDAVPFNLAAGENQPIWVDIYTPADTPAGLYNGTATITSSQGTSTVLVSLNVWDFSLPKERSLHGSTNTIESLTSRTTAVELLKHRFNPKFVDRADERFLIDNYGLDMVHVFSSGGAGYGNCQTDPAPLVSDVLNATANHEPELYLFTSYANEVWECTSLFPEFLAWATNLRLGGSHPFIVTFPVDELMGPDLDHTAADIWVVLPKHYDQAKTNIEALINHPSTQVWSYNPLVQDGYSPKFTIDFLPINARIMQGFINQSLGLTGTKFWRVDYWTNDPWNNAEAYRVDAPGEGHMVYPGDDVGLPNQIVSGVRMKWFREGSEDYEYIQILKDLGQEQFALDTTRTVAIDFHTWTQDKDALYAARILLGEKIHSLDSNPPVAVDDTYGTDEDVALNVTAPGVLANDTDPEDDPLTPVLVSGPSNGSLTLNTDGSFTYIPNADHSGIDSFTYQANDGLADSNIATVSITVNPINDPPVAGDDAYSTNGDTTLDVAAPGVLADDSDPEGDPLTPVLVSGPSNGSLTLNADGSFTYNPNPGFTGNDSFVYEICDLAGLCDMATVNITISGNQVYYVSSSSNGTVGGIPFKDEDILAFDPNTGTWSMFFAGVAAGLPSGADIDALHVNADGSVLLSLTTAEAIPDVGSIEDSDIVRFIPAAPGDYTAGTFEWYFDGSDVELAANGEDIDAIGLAPDGRLIISTNASFAVPNISGKDEDLIIFTGTLGEITSGSFELYLDGNAAAVGLATSSEDINGTWIDNDGDIYLTTSGVFDVTGALGNGADIFSCVPGSTGPVTSCAFSLFWDGSANGFGAEVMDGLSLSGGSGGPANSAPTANDDAVSTPQDTAVNINVAANDTDPDGNLDPSSATVTSTPSSGSVTNNGDGSFTYTPNTSFNGNDSFNYRIYDTGEDGDGSTDADDLCDTAVVNITVSPSAPTTVEVRVAASSDDAEEKQTGRVGLTSTDLELVFDSSDQTVGMRFNGVTIPQGASITYAHIQFQADETHSDPTALTIQGEANDNAPTFVNSTNDVTNREITAASVAWAPQPWTTTGEAGPDQQTPDIASVIQEIVNRPNWSSGNSLAIIITGTGKRVAEAYDGDAAGAPLLHVEYASGN